MLPAMEIGADWCGVVGYPPDIQWVTGGVKGESQLPDLIDDYDVVVLQQPQGDSWERTIEAMREHGVKVVYEIDDYVHGIQKAKDHAHAETFDDRRLELYEKCMRACDAMICSTQYIADQYAEINPNVHVCRNGVDLRRYQLGKPKRDTVNVGWAGSTGHRRSMMPWLNQVGNVMQQKPEVTFISIGEPFATALQPAYGDRAIAVPWCAIEQYPAAMTMFDITLAPGGSGPWHRGKSDLRWLEASALGIPIIAQPRIYREIEDGVTGFHATAPADMVPPLMELIGDKKLREKIGTAAKDYVTEHRTIEAVAREWVRALEHVHAG
jgi:glycosyltransferase involved in cell wall biosynthesis